MLGRAARLIESGKGLDKGLRALEMWLLFGVWLTSTACGRINYERLHDGAVFDAPSCDGSLCSRPDVQAFGPFGAPTVLTALNVGGKPDDPTLTPDGLTIYFAAATAGLEEIWVASRSSLSVPFDTPVRAPGLNGLDADGPHVSNDQLTMWFTHNPTGCANCFDIFVSQRGSTSEPWGPPTTIAGLNSAVHDGGVSLTDDELLMFFESGRGGAVGGYDIWYSKRASTSEPWGTPLNLKAVNSPTNDYGPGISSDGLTLTFFTLDLVQDERDLWITTRPDRNSDFAPPQPIGELNTDRWEADPWISPDLRRILFASDRDGPTGAYQIYEATR